MLKIHLDQIDLKILEELQNNGKSSNVELARKVGLSPSPCLGRVRKLEEAGFIDRYVALVNPEKLGATVSVFIQVTLERQTESVLEDFERNIETLPEVMECYLMSGESDYLLRVVVRDTNALRDFILDRLTRASGVANIRSSFALRQVKYKTALPLSEIL